MPEAAATVWKPYPIGSENQICLALGQITVRCLRRGLDLLVKEERNPTENTQANAMEEQTARRYAFESAVTAVEVVPTTPSRPLVVRPLQPLVLAPRAKVTFLVSFPVEVRLLAHTAKGTVKMEHLPSEILSDTWFGDSLEGVLCLALRSRAQRDRDTLGPRLANRALCTLQISNESTDPLKCEKFCLRLEHCKLWSDPSGLWTSPIRIRYRGTEQLSAVDYEDSPPEAARSAHLVAEAEAPLSQGLVRRTFGFTGLFPSGV